MHHTRPKASIRESIVNSDEAGLLTCNIFATLPIPKDSGYLLAKTVWLLTVARQLVICTRFPINLR